MIIPNFKVVTQIFYIITITSHTQNECSIEILDILT